MLQHAIDTKQTVYLETKYFSTFCGNVSQRQCYLNFTHSYLTEMEFPLLLTLYRKEFVTFYEGDAIDTETGLGLVYQKDEERKVHVGQLHFTEDMMTNLSYTQRSDMSAEIDFGNFKLRFQ